MLYKAIYYNVSQATANLHKDLNSFNFADQIQINFFSLLKKYCLGIFSCNSFNSGVKSSSPDSFNCNIEKPLGGSMADGGFHNRKVAQISTENFFS